MKTASALSSKDAARGRPSSSYIFGSQIPRSSANFLGMPSSCYSSSHVNIDLAAMATSVFPGRYSSIAAGRVRARLLEPRMSSYKPAGSSRRVRGASIGAACTQSPGSRSMPARNTKNRQQRRLRTSGKNAIASPYEEQSGPYKEQLPPQLLRMRTNLVRMNSNRAYAGSRIDPITAHLSRYLPSRSEIGGRSFVLAFLPSTAPGHFPASARPVERKDPSRAIGQARRWPCSRISAAIAQARARMTSEYYA